MLEHTFYGYLATNKVTYAPQFPTVQVSRLTKFYPITEPAAECYLFIEYTIARETDREVNIDMNITFPSILQSNPYRVSVMDGAGMEALGHYPFSMSKYIGRHMTISWKPSRGHEDRLDGHEKLSFERVIIKERCGEVKKEIKFVPVDGNESEPNKDIYLMAEERPSTTTETPTTISDETTTEKSSSGNENVPILSLITANFILMMRMYR